MAKNTKMEFLYRDASNWKQWNVAVLEGTLTEEQRREIIDCCDDGEYFIPELVGLPATRFGSTTEDDHPFCELCMDNFSETDAEPTVTVTAEELLERFRANKGKWESSVLPEFSSAIEQKVNELLDSNQDNLEADKDTSDRYAEGYHDALLDILNGLGLPVPAKHDGYYD